MILHSLHHDFQLIQLQNPHRMQLMKKTFRLKQKIEMQYGDVYIIILYYEEWKIKEEINLLKKIQIEWVSM